MARKTIDEGASNVIMADMAIGDLLTTVEAAAVLGISRIQVGNYVRSKKLRAIRKGRAYLIEAKSVHAFKPQPKGNPNFSKKTS